MNDPARRPPAAWAPYLSMLKADGWRIVKLEPVPLFEPALSEDHFVIVEEA